ncbi:hypothetical protein [Streptomyces sp. 351MFTsu5.1]|uniref:hypothetical protein n=1 Tax=Streptomyces sp. 351MFTsu5.1 TaxID=1172180 RepID=UPI00131A0CCB|nr:hypothetical protein [Streptomyces sp. 351MFTsu5.1]
MNLRALSCGVRKALLVSLTLGVTGVSAACVAAHDEPSPAPSNQTVSAVPATTTAAGIVPTEMVGAWESAQPGSNTTLAYRFTADGRYAHAGVLTYPVSPVANEYYLLKRTSTGAVEVDGRTLTLRPSSATTTRKDPAHPGDDYTERPASLAPRRFVWSLADGVFTLTDEDGLRFVFRRVDS